MKYEYMKEYKTNGQRPEGLADDVLVDCYATPYNKWRRDDLVENWFWDSIKKFRIVDERFKPASDTDVGSNWYERGELPPVGSRCLAKVDSHHVQCTIIAYHDDLVWLLAHDHERTPVRVSESCDFKPIPTERDKLALKLYREVNWNSDDKDEDVLSLTRFNDYRKAIDAGWRPIKQQSEEEFVDYGIGVFEGLITTKKWRELYRARCRFIEQGE